MWQARGAVRGDAGRGSGCLGWNRCDDLTTEGKPCPRSRAAAGNRKTSHNPLGKANRHEFAPPHGEQNLAVSE